MPSGRPSSSAQLPPSIRKQIIILSAILTHFKVANSPPKSRKRDDTDLAFLQSIASILTTGSPDSPTAPLVNALWKSASSDTNTPAIELIFTQNHRPAKLTHSTPSSTFTNIIPNTEKGEDLLERWSSYSGLVYFLFSLPLLIHPSVSDTTYKQHLQDVVDVLAYISTTSNIKHLMDFIVFLHWRAYHKLLSQVKQFSAQWGTKFFDLPLSKPQIDYLSNEGLTATNPNEKIFAVTTENLDLWIRTFSRLWKTLSSEISNIVLCIPAPKSLRPSTTRFPVICFLISTLCAMREVFQHLLMCTSMGFHVDLRRREGLMFAQREERHKHGQKGELLDLQAADEFSSESKESLPDQVYRSFGTILSWHTSALALWEHRNVFSTQFRARRLSYVDMSSCSFTVNDVNEVWKKIQKKSLTTKNTSTFAQHSASLQKAMRSLTTSISAQHATVYAEAILMAHILHEVTSGRLSKACVKDGAFAIGVSKKSCGLCQHLADTIHNEDEKITFHLPGTHATIFPWAPPLHLPQTVLLSIRDCLLAAAANPTLSHSRMSSGAGSEADRKSLLEMTE
ncbi:hypothetical protein GYMLUDRAFT_241895 [Collybiopsis luxurians FD-317 M1]|uniref:Uncharacterized protein n=1 Tax=Collybiopsis luxurians FD-317 M1 TaxID=944289 RepID=A0A0D0CUY7_9AGAR|nr:hypothetical protein GYMLUDRAFT_241895 [Collybiopsis luxurians FD-317 M1]